jgi:hypothetical protein
MVTFRYAYSVNQSHVARMVTFRYAYSFNQLKERDVLEDLVVEKENSMDHPRANYIDRAPLLVRGVSANLFVDSVRHVVSVTDP